MNAINPTRGDSLGRPILPDGRSGSGNDRFWPNVDTTPGHGPKGECWVWTGSRRSAEPYNYGQASAASLFPGLHRPIGTHVISWVLHNGPIPKGLHVCHKCDNPPCVRPDHLFLGTPKANVRDAQRKGRMRRAEPKPEPVRHWRIKLTPEQGAQVRDARRVRKLTIYDLQTAIATDYTHIHVFEKGKRRIALEQFHCMCRFIGIDYDTLGISESQLTFSAHTMGSPERKARGGKWETVQIVFKNRMGAEVRPHKFWERFQSTNTSLYRADLICEALIARRKPMRDVYAESGVYREKFMQVLGGNDVHFSLLKQVALYAGVPWDSLFDTAARQSKAA